MKPIGPLMREHRTIERMLALLGEEARRINEGRGADTLFIASAVDFFRTYADRTHHGKEEDILFKALENKKITPELRRITDELISEHKVSRNTVAVLNNANAAYIGGNDSAIKDIKESMEKLMSLYPRHIEKEDKHYFYPVQEYFDRREQDAMLQEFREFDRKMIHEKYKKVIDDMRNRLA